MPKRDAGSFIFEAICGLQELRAELLLAHSKGASGRRKDCPKHIRGEAKRLDQLIGGLADIRNGKLKVANA